VQKEHFMATVYLNQAHKNFQVGKTPLQKSISSETHILVISVILIGAIGLIAYGGNSLRFLWRFEATSIITDGSVTSCSEESSGSATDAPRSYSNLYFSYSVNAQTYRGTAQRDNHVCDKYPTGTIITVNYLPDMPKEYSADTGFPGSNWYYFIGLGFLACGLVFFLLAKNRRERYRYLRLQKANTILEAKVRKIIESISGNGSQQKRVYRAEYDFRSPINQLIYTTIAVRKGQVQEGDSFQILYVDDETFCVL
jgi:hypothetical protein